MRHTNRADIHVWPLLIGVILRIAKHLRFRREFRMHFEANGYFIFSFRHRMHSNLKTINKKARLPKLEVWRLRASPYSQTAKESCSTGSIREPSLFCVIKRDKTGMGAIMQLFTLLGRSIVSMELGPAFWVGAREHYERIHATTSSGGVSL